MEAKELRIGNLVHGIYYDDEDVEQFDECRIMAIDTTDNAEYTYWVEGKANKELYHDFIGMPLTKDRLLRIGFKAVGIMNFHQLEIKHQYKELTMYLMANPNGKAMHLGKRDGKEGDFLIDCEYVHQAQNLIYTLAGEELEIK